MKQKNYRKNAKTAKFLQKVSKVIVAFSILSVTLTTVFLTSSMKTDARNLDDCIDTSYCESLDVITRNNTICDSTYLNYFEDSILNKRYELIDEINKYMKKNSRRPKMSAEYMIAVCEDKGFDICLLLSQAQQESSFGYAMRGNSCFGVISKKYKNTDEAIDDYVRIMQTYYIIDRSPEELIKSNFRMERNKKAKYAGDPTYGTKIGGIRNRIIKTTNIYTLFNELVSMNEQLALLKDKNNTMQNLLAMRMD